MNESHGVLWDPTGPRLEIKKYADDDARHRFGLHLADLNPSMTATWTFSRWTLIQIGIWFIRRALFARCAQSKDL